MFLPLLPYGWVLDIISVKLIIFYYLRVKCFLQWGTWYELVSHFLTLLCCYFFLLLDMLHKSFLLSCIIAHVSLLLKPLPGIFFSLPWSWPCSRHSWFWLNLGPHFLYCQHFPSTALNSPFVCFAHSQLCVFFHAASYTWNSLPINVRKDPSLSSFKKLLKIYLFCNAFL